MATRKEWLDALHERSRAAPPVIYIHGYFNDESEALIRAYAIRALLCSEASSQSAPWTCAAKRPVVALTWPSYNRFAKYTWDEANSEWTEAHATELVLEIVRTNPGAVVIAHSMGNRILVKAALAAADKGHIIKRLILASADVDRQYVAELLEHPSGLGFPTTIYASRKDQALSASWRTHGNPRAGDLSYWVTGQTSGYPYRIFHNTEIVDTTPLHAGITGHAAFIETPEAAADLCHVLADDPNPPGRSPESIYWILDAKGVSGDSCEQRALAAVRIAKSSPGRFRPRRTRHGD